MNHKWSYRSSHTGDGDATRYSGTYQRGYYCDQWKSLEEPLLRSILARHQRAEDLRALDFACGTGRILAILEEYFAETTGVDVSESMVTMARRTCLKSTLLQRDITMEPLNLQFDLATAFRFFVNAEPSLRKQALEAIHHCLRPGGTLIANVHQSSTSLLGMAYRARNAIRRRMVANVLSHDEFAELLVNCGFSVVDTYWYSFLPRPGWFAGDLCGRMMVPVENAWKRLKLPERWAQSFIVCAVSH